MLVHVSPTCRKVPDPRHGLLDLKSTILRIPPTYLECLPKQRVLPSLPQVPNPRKIAQESGCPEFQPYPWIVHPRIPQKSRRASPKCPLPKTIPQDFPTTACGEVSLSDNGRMAETCWVAMVEEHNIQLVPQVLVGQGSTRGI